jgi:SAM-dependent methyltransferase
LPIESELMIEVNKLIAKVFEHSSVLSLSENDRAFLGRVLSTPECVYRVRVEAVGFAGLERVLDAGCGFGQWSVPLAQLNQRVDVIDVSSERIQLARVLCALRGVKNVDFQQTSIEALPFSEGSFDGIFSYSVLYLTDWRKSLAELYRCLKPNGRLYLNTNGLGWYLFNLVEDHNSCDGFSSKKMATDSLASSIRYYSGNQHDKGQSIVMPSEVVIPYLSGLGAEIVATGADGSISLGGSHKPVPFFDPDKFGLESVWEVVCRKAN